jgi:hypothetical protein
VLGIKRRLSVGWVGCCWCVGVVVSAWARAWAWAGCAFVGGGVDVSAVAAFVAWLCLLASCASGAGEGVVVRLEFERGGVAVGVWDAEAASWCSRAAAGV